LAAQKFTRKDLKHDSFVSGTEQVLEFLQKHATLAGGALLVVVVLLVGWSYVSKGKAASQAEASYMLYEGQMYVGDGQYDMATVTLQDCIAEHGDSDPGRYARVSLVQAMLGQGDTQGALEAIDRYLGEVPASHVTHGDLRLLRPYALADAGRYGEAADAMANLISRDLADGVYYDRTVRQAEWLRLGGRGADAVAVLEALKADAAAGEIEITGADLDRRIDIARATAR
jgi:predicted negative regulator of RcsB-dependent stress response